MVDGVGGFGVGLSNSCRKCSTSASSHHHALAVLVKAQEFVPCRANLSADSGAASLSCRGPLEQMCVELPEDGRPSYHISDFSFAPHQCRPSPPTRGPRAFELLLVENRVYVGWRELLLRSASAPRGTIICSM